MSEEFMNTSGKKYRLRPVSETLIIQSLAEIEKKYRAKGEPLDPPTYKAIIAGGIEEEYPHDEKSLIVEGDEEQTKKNQEAWAKYLDANSRLNSEQMNQRNRLWLLRGVDIKIPDDGWDKEQEQLFGITVPTDPVERKYHYITTEILVTVDDYFEAIQGIARLSMAGLVSQEVLKTRVDSFRSDLQQKTTQQTGNEEVIVATQLELTGNPHSEGVGNDSKSV